MSEPLARDRLYPSLLDRLTDDDPGRQTEPREARAASMQRLRDNVLRDLNWLFNATQAGPDIAGDELAGTSVLNFGMPALAGRPASRYDLVEVARVLREVIVRFEPRILTSNLKVRAERVGPDSHNVLGFRIEGQLWSQPVPLDIFMRTEIDLESGLSRVLETRAP